MTQIEEATYSGTWRWTIPKFSQYVTPGESIESPTFGFEDKEKWYLVLYPNGSSKETKDEMWLSLCCKSKNKLVKPSVAYNFSILSSNAENPNHTEMNCLFVSNENKWPKLTPRSYIIAHSDAYLPNDYLTIACRISKFVFPTKNKYKFNVPSGTCQLENLQAMIRSNSLGEIVTVKVGNQEFKVYKGLLTSQSPVFAAMFDIQANKESQENTVRIEDIDAQVFKEILEFMLTDRFDYSVLSSINLKDILAVADKYMLQRLKALCEEALYEALTVENSVEHLLLADLHHGNQLKNAIMDFIILNMSDVIKTDTYMSMKLTLPQLICEIFERLAEQKEKQVQIRKQSVSTPPIQLVQKQSSSPPHLKRSRVTTD